MAILSPKEIKTALEKVPEWKKRGAAIARTFEFDDFAGSMHFVNAVAKLAEKVGHHPDIDIRWNQVTLTLSTHSEGGLTKNDFDLAQKIDPLV